MKALTGKGCGMRLPMLVAVAIGGLVARYGHADDVTNAADAIIAAAKESNPEAVLKALGAKGYPDPWLVVDELCWRERIDVAKAFAKHLGDSRRAARLVKYVESQRGEVREPARRTRYRAAREKLRHDNGAAALKTLGRLEEGPGDVLAVLTAQARAEALRESGHKASSERAYVRAARKAHALGWRAKTNFLLRYICYESIAEDGAFWVNGALVTRLGNTVAASEAVVLYGRIQDEHVAIAVAGGSANFVPLGDTSAIDRATIGLRKMSEGSSVNCVKAKRLLWQPLGLGEGIERVVVVPQTRLADLPFGLIVGERELTHVALQQTWILARDVGRGEGVLAVHGPTGAGGPVESGGAEARAVGSVVLGGNRATKQLLRKTLKKRARWRAVHLACPFKPKTRSVVLRASAGKGGLLSAPDLMDARINADLLVLSGSHTAQVGLAAGDDGLPMLPPSEKLEDMSLDELREWGEKLKRLNRKFEAGEFGDSFLVGRYLPRVMVSLWEIDREATEALMREFYRRWNPKESTAGIGAASALRAAQQFVRSHDKWRHPYYWAGWQLWGKPD
jgi:hypothetical protein